MKLLVSLTLALLACTDRPPTHTEDGKTCAWQNNGQAVLFSSGTCIKDGRVYTCMFSRDRAKDPGVITCGVTGPVPSESP